jgi:hypothetical protein
VSNDLCNGRLRPRSVNVTKRGRPTKNEESFSEDQDAVSQMVVKSKRLAVPDQIRYNNISHFPMVLVRCRVCNAITQVACVKCDVKLCLTATRNCYYDYHNWYSIVFQSVLIVQYNSFLISEWLKNFCKWAVYTKRQVNVKQ